MVNVLLACNVFNPLQDSVTTLVLPNHLLVCLLLLGLLICLLVGFFFLGGAGGRGVCQDNYFKIIMSKNILSASCTKVSTCNMYGIKLKRKSAMLQPAPPNKQKQNKGTNKKKDTPHPKKKKPKTKRNRILHK